MLKITNLSKTYKKGKKAVNNVSLHIEAGDIYGFIGHNGAGKTTTIKCVTGIIDFEEGDIQIKDMNIKSNPLGCKQIMAYIPDQPDIYDNLTGIKYLNFIADIYAVSKNDREERIKKYADEFDLTKSLGSLVSTYSHGMRQKLSIIAALIHKPDLLILDEPFVGLDPKAAHDLKNILKSICQEGSAVFFSTHVLEVAEKLCNKIAIIKGGQIIVNGRTEEVLKNNSLEGLFMELIDNEK